MRILGIYFDSYPGLTPGQKRSLTLRAQRGAEHLDFHYPGWEGEIELEDLDLSSENSCILGQVYGSYSSGLRETEIGVEKEIEDTRIKWSVERACYIDTRTGEEEPFYEPEFEFEGDPKMATRLGFLIRSNGIPDSNEAYSYLTEAWVKIILTRRGMTPYWKALPREVGLVGGY